MAIDTEAKRRGKVPPLWVLPLADGTISQADRQHKGYKYPGILTETPAGTPTSWVGTVILDIQWIDEVSL